MSDLVQQYVESVSSGHRSGLGQFFTPPGVARFMCDWVLKDSPGEVFDPAFGLGAFYDAVRELDSATAFKGMEVDRDVLGFRTIRDPGFGVEHADYLTSWGRHYQAIVCNPPYMRFQKFINRDEVRPLFRKHLNMNLSGYVNIASAFLLKSLSELKDGGRMAYIMPLEFLNTGYGAQVKKEMLDSGALTSIVRISCEKDVFPDVQTTVGVFLFHKSKKPAALSYYTCEALGDLPGLLQGEPVRKVPVDKLEAADKWMSFFEPGEFTTHPGMVPLSDYGQFKRGIATGANAYFAMSLWDAKKHGIPKENLVPCITKSAQLQSGVFRQRDFDTLAESGAPVFLFDGTGSPHPRVDNYIKIGEEKQYHKRYLTKVRKPWYKLEKRDPAPLMFGVFSRNKFKVIRNLSQATYLTCYHGFYPGLFGAGFMDHLFLYFQSSAARKILALSKRNYGDGLDKFEPNDLNGALVPSADWFSRISASDVERAMVCFSSQASIPGDLEDVFATLCQHVPGRMAAAV